MMMEIPETWKRIIYKLITIKNLVEFEQNYEMLRLLSFL